LKAQKFNISAPSANNNNGHHRPQRAENAAKKRKAIELLEDITESVEYDDYSKIYHDSFDFYIREIRKRFDNEKLKPLINIYNLICDQVCLTVDIKKTFEIYKSIVNLDRLKSQTINWYEYKGLNKLKDLDSIIIHFKNNHCVKDIFSEIVVLIKVYLTVGLVSVECERALSCLKRIKTYDRTTIGQSRLSALSILNFNNSFIHLIDLDEAVDEFNTFYKRRMKL
jgi:hypothetical protein